MTEQLPRFSHGIPGKRMVFLTSADIIRFAKSIGFKEPFLNEYASALMTGYFNVHDLESHRRIYGSWRQTTALGYEFEVWEIV